MKSHERFNMSIPVRLHERIKDRLKSTKDPSPIFPLIVGWAGDYNSLFSESFLSTAEATNSLIKKSRESGRVLLCGKGGSAKSVLLQRIARILFKNGSIPLLMQLREWNGTDNKLWSSIRGHRARIYFLLERFTGIDVQINDLDIIDPNAEKFILLDGLNEVSSRIGQDIINAVDEFAASEPNVCVIISDRLVRREFINPNRWKLAMSLPLSKKFIKTIISNKKYQIISSLLRTPYFLNCSLKSSHGGSSAISGHMKSHFSNHALDSREIFLASKAAFEVYASKSRSFKFDDFKKICGNNISKKLKESGDILLASEGMAYFEHHLKHDFLSAYYISRDPRKWTHKNFNIISFRASSFDSILMLVELCSNERSAERILRSLYDWNPYAPGYVIAEGLAENVTLEMKVVILAMISERKWDPIIPTSQKANDILHLINSDMSRKFRSAIRINSVRAEVRKVKSLVHWFNKWRNWYLKSSASDLKIEELIDLSESDSICGWVSANVLRRFPRIPISWMKMVLRYTKSPETAIAWRAVHVLGAFPSRPSFNALRYVIRKGKDPDVIFGATRSMIELAARGSSSFGEKVIKFLVENFEFIASQPNVPEELGRAIFIENFVIKESGKRPIDWFNMAIPLLHRLVIHSGDPESREYWERIANRFYDGYAKR